MCECALYQKISTSSVGNKAQITYYKRNNTTTQKWVYATGRQEEEDGRTLVCDKRDKAISYVFCRDLHLTSMFSGLLQKDLFKGRWILAKSYFKQNYCHACHTRFAVFFPLLSCCVSSLIKSPGQLYCLVPLFLILLTIMLQNYQPPFMMLKLTLASILIACFLLTITKARTFHRHHYQDAEPHGRVPFKRFFLKVGIT